MTLITTTTTINNYLESWACFSHSLSLFVRSFIQIEWPYVSNNGKLIGWQDIKRRENRTPLTKSKHNFALMCMYILTMSNCIRSKKKVFFRYKLLFSSVIIRVKQKQKILKQKKFGITSMIWQQLPYLSFFSIRLVGWLAHSKCLRINCV